MANFDISRLPVLLTATELGKLLGLPDGRRLNRDRKPSHVIYLHGRPTALFPMPLDLVHSAISVNANAKAQL
jgi:hypothetical protein